MYPENAIGRDAHALHAPPPPPPLQILAQEENLGLARALEAGREAAAGLQARLDAAAADNEDLRVSGLLGCS